MAEFIDPIWEYEHDNLTRTQQAMERHIAFLCANEYYATGSFSADWKGFVSRRADKNANLLEREEYRALIQSPYVGRMDFEAEKGTETENIVTYIGERSVYLDDRFFVYDWRTPVGQRFYIKNDLSFEHNDYNYTLMLRRAILIKNAVLDGYDTEYQNTDYTGAGAPSVSVGEGMEIAQNVVTEPFLIRILKERREKSELSPIIISMQEEQNNINRESIDENIIVQGCAGSGKTMILLHRLSFLKYNNPELNWDRVKIITPNELFNVHINKLSERLELSQIERVTVEAYYGRILLAYEEYRISNKSSSVKDKNVERRKKTAEIEKLVHNVKSEAAVDEKLVNYVYSDAFLENFRVCYNEWWDSFEKSVDYDGIDKINRRYGYNQRVTHENNTFKRISVYAQIVAAIKSVQSANDQKREERSARVSVFDEKIDRENRLINVANARADELVKNAQVKAGEIATSEGLAAYNPRTDNLEYHLRMLGAKDTSLNGSFRQIVAARDEARVSEMRKAEQESGKNELLQEIQGYDDIGLSTEETTLLDKAKEALKAFDIEKLYAEVYAMSCEGYAEKKPSVLAYRYQMYAKTQFYYMLFGKVRTPEQILCVDEAQDVSVNEYKLWSTLGSGVKFNLYGDLNQKIKQGRGIESWDDLDTVFESKRFLLGINYRNAVEISQYSNSALGMNDVAVGISGKPVRECTQAEVESEIAAREYEHRRVAVVFSPKSKSSTSAARQLTAISDTLIGADISVITIEQAKGLEFETVYLFTDSMSKSERYIGYTRALDELVVVQMP